MKIYQGKSKVKNLSIYAGFNGYRNLINGRTAADNNYFYSCRDAFAQIFHKPDILYLSKSDRPIINVARFITAIEKKLNITPSKFYKTQNKQVLYIRVSSFWMKHKIRKSLFTLLLRIGRNYKNNYVSTLNRYRDISSFARAAIFKFLDGNTKFTWYCSEYGMGWKHWFNNANHLDLLQPEK